MIWKPFLWRDDLIELRNRLHRRESARLIEALCVHLIRVYRRPSGLLRSVAKVG
jgi:hypothetical protein